MKWIWKKWECTTLSKLTIPLFLSIFAYFLCLMFLPHILLHTDYRNNLLIVFLVHIIHLVTMNKSILSHEIVALLCSWPCLPQMMSFIQCDRRINIEKILFQGRGKFATPTMMNCIMVMVMWMNTHQKTDHQETYAFSAGGSNFHKVHSCRSGVLSKNSHKHQT